MVVGQGYGHVLCEYKGFIFFMKEHDYTALPIVWHIPSRVALLEEEEKK